MPDVLQVFGVKIVMDGSHLAAFEVGAPDGAPAFAGAGHGSLLRRQDRLVPLRLKFVSGGLEAVGLSR